MTGLMAGFFMAAAEQTSIAQTGLSEAVLKEAAVQAITQMTSEPPGGPAVRLAKTPSVL